RAFLEWPHPPRRQSDDPARWSGWILLCSECPRRDGQQSGAGELHKLSSCNVHSAIPGEHHDLVECIRAKYSVSTSLGAAHASQSARQRPAGFLPGVESAPDVACRGKTGVLRRLYRHGRALAEGAVEQEPFAGRFGKPMQHAARADTLLQCRVRHMQRAWDGTLLLAF